MKEKVKNTVTILIVVLVVSVCMSADYMHYYSCDKETMGVVTSMETLFALTSIHQVEYEYVIDDVTYRGHEIVRFRNYHENEQIAVVYQSGNCRKSKIKR